MRQTSKPTDATMGLILGLIGVLIFSATLPVTRIAVTFFDPGFLTFARAMLATLAAGVTLAAMRRRFPRDHVIALLFIGVTLIYGFPGFMALAMQTVPSSHGGVVLGILPLTTALFAVVMAGERPSVLFWFWNVIGATLIIIFTLRDSTGGGFGFAPGDFWLLAAGITASAGYVASGKLSHIMPGWEVICWTLVLFTPVSLAGSIWFWHPLYLSPPNSQLAAFAYLGLGSMFLGFFAWNTGLRLGGLSKIGQLQLLQTFFTLAIAAVLLGEQISVEMLVFACAILLVVTLGRKSKVTIRN